jgi:crotonobetainyl-CoA:carnitine CoA-transferase CaiB-like acyl-CoA transferase
MTGPMEGVKVVEMGFWVAGPSAAAILADWGASVVKIEPPEGDPFRGLLRGLGVQIPSNPPFELDNRGKRSIALNLASDEAKAVARKLLDEADVFITNVRPGSVDRLGLDYETVRKSNPRIVYCQVTGYGPDTPERDRAAYDVGAFWARAGVARSLVPGTSDAPPPQQRGGMGDHMTGLGAAGAISAALFRREKSGEGQRVAVSLTRIGAYMMGWDYNTVLRMDMPIMAYDREHSPNPIINCYRAGDGRWFWLLLLQADRHWPDLMRALDGSGIAEDGRFGSIMSRMQNAEALVGALDAEFAKRPLSEWGAIFDREDVWYAPVQSIPEALADPITQANGVVVDVPSGEGTVRMVATPADFYGTPWAPQGPVPELGQHTEEVLLELGYEWEQIAALKEKGAIP